MSTSVLVQSHTLLTEHRWLHKWACRDSLRQWPGFTCTDLKHHIPAYVYHLKTEERPSDDLSPHSRLAVSGFLEHVWVAADGGTTSDGEIRVQMTLVADRESQELVPAVADGPNQRWTMGVCGWLQCTATSVTSVHDALVSQEAPLGIAWPSQWHRIPTRLLLNI